MIRTVSLASLALLCTIAACSRPPDAADAVAPAPAADAVRELARGAVGGFVNAAGGHSWLGIPYAAPPVVELRWRAPQPFGPWDGTRGTLRAGPACVQYGWATGGVGPSGSHQGREDCLYLNVYAPRMDAAAAATAHLPVMVWIHGGSNTIGQAASYDGSRLAATQNVVVMTMNYRLGPFGWFLLPRGGAGGEPPADPIDASGNWGNLDVLASLRWVHEHVGAFGGDPGNVTVFGESAGAANAVALLVSPLSEGLLHRVIVESLAFGFAQPSAASHYSDDPEPGFGYSSGEILLKALVQAGRAADRAAAKALVARLGSAEIAAFLRGLDPWVLYALYHPSNIETRLFPTIFQDGAVVREGPLEELLADPARHIAVPTMLGTNLDEAKLFMAFDPRLVMSVGGVPLWIRDPAAYERESIYRSLLWRANAVTRPAIALAAGGNPAFAYRWDWRDEGRRLGIVDLSRLLGAAHGVEIPFVFGSFDDAPGHEVLYTADNRAGRVQLSDAMMSYWAQFAASGRPGRGRDGKLPEWPAWSAATAAPQYLLFDTAPHGGIRAGDEPASREGVVALMELQEPAGPAACAMFRATFRQIVDPWADAAWLRFRNGYCAMQPPGASRIER